MKHLHLAALLTLWAAFAQAQPVFLESFETGVPGQMTQEYVAGVLDWNTDGVNIGAVQPTAVDGDSAAFLFFAAASFDETALVTPVLDLSAGFFRLGFWHVQGLWFGDQNTLTVEVSNDGGTNWTIIDFFASDIPFWTYREYNLGDYVTLTATTQVRFTGFIAYGWAVGLDAISIFPPEPIDAIGSAIISPVTGCGLGTETVSLVVTNDGTTDITSIDAAYSLDGSAAVIETFTVSIAPGESDTLTFTQTVDASVFGDYDLMAWTELSGDLDNTNDTASFTFTNVPAIVGLPYFNDFETGSNGWTSTGTNGLWELGDPEAFTIDTAYSGVNAWVTNLNQPTYNNDQFSYLVSPCFDLSGMVLDPILSFAIAYQSEQNYDGTWVEVSTDGGNTWAVVGAFGDATNWYNVAADNIFNFNVPADYWGGYSNETGEWILTEHLLTGAAGSSSVRFRIAFSSDLSVNGYDGFAIDDISLEEQPAINAEVLNVVSPLSGCALSNIEALTVTVVNAGSDPITDIELFYTLDDLSAISETFSVNLSSLDTAVVTFTQTLDLSVLGAHTITVWAVLPNDGDLDNDTVSVEVWSYPLITSVPYFNDFENGNGGWTSEGTNGVWELGDPTGTIIDDAYSGTNCWATNLNTLLYQNQQLSYLTSPCFDLSTLTDDPLMSFALQFNSEINWDGVWVEKSIDGGLTWSTVGTVGQGMNWYNTANAFNALIPGPSWTGNSGAASEWVVAETLLSGVGGEGSVKVRFIFSSDFSVNTFEGFALDDIFIYPQPQLDLVALGMPEPESGCGLDDETVKIRFWNKGLQTVQNFQVGYSVDGGTPVTQNCPLTVAYGDTAVFTFSTPADLSTPGLHQIDVFTALQGDEYPNSDLSADNEVTHYGNTPLTQTITTSEPVSATIPTGTQSSVYFCGLPTALNGCFRINSVTIGSLPHTYPSDMLIYLISPAGDTVALSLANGGAVPNVNDVVFSDAAVTSITTQVNGIAPGTYQPQQPLSDLYDGQDPNGAWTLYIQDTFFGDDGVLQEWGMSFVDNAPLPQLGSDIEMCVNYTDTITVTGGNFSSVLWSNGWSGNPVIFSGDDLGVGTHDLSVIVDIAGCTGFSDTITVTVNECVGIDETEGAAISVYPNPTVGAVTVDVPAGVNATQVRLTDATGRTVSTTAINGGLGRRSVEVSIMAKGVYMLVVEGEGVLHTERLVVR